MLKFLEYFISLWISRLSNLASYIFFLYCYYCLAHFYLLSVTIFFIFLFFSHHFTFHLSLSVFISATLFPRVLRLSFFYPFPFLISPCNFCQSQLPLGPSHFILERLSPVFSDTSALHNKYFPRLQRRKFKLPGMCSWSKILTNFTTGLLIALMSLSHHNKH